MNAVRREDEEIIIKETRAPHSVIVLVQPGHMSDMKPVADHVLEGKAVIVNMKFADQETRLRMVDFFRGVMYTLNGIIERISADSVILLPYGCEAQNLVHLVLDDRDQDSYF